MKHKQPKLVDRLAMGEFVNGAAPVSLDGDVIATLYRTPGWIEAEVMGEPYGGGKNYSTALRSVAVGYQELTGNWEA